MMKTLQSSHPYLRDLPDMIITAYDCRRNGTSMVEHVLYGYGREYSVISFSPYLAVDGGFGVDIRGQDAFGWTQLEIRA